MGEGRGSWKSCIKIFPNADFYTSFINTSALRGKKLPRKIHSSWLQRISLVRYYPRVIQLSSPFLWPLLKLDDYEIVISHGGFYLAQLINIKKFKRRSLRIHYMITPPKNLYLEDHRVWFEILLNQTYYHFLRFLDKKAMKNADHIWAVSGTVGKRIQSIYKRNFSLLYPPVSIPRKPPQVTENRYYYCYAGRLSKEKNISLLIDAFNKNKQPLVIVGRGKEELKLKMKARSNIKFAGFKTTSELAKILRQAKAFIHPAKDDDFPLAPIEAMANGTPVISHVSGGTNEAIIEGKTGLTFEKCTVRSLNKAVRSFEEMVFDPNQCYFKAKEFSVERFKKEVSLLLAEAYERHF